MDGNGRWAKARNKMRVSGHREGVKRVREIVRACSDKGVEALTLFAFSSENWRRPKVEVALLMELFKITLDRELAELHKKGVRIRFIGDRSRFSKGLRKRIEAAEEKTANNTGMAMIIAANYGGQWDITEACRRMAAQVKTGKMELSEISADVLAAHLSLADFPEPDLFIRTGGEKRISNFLLWNLAYSELWFTDTWWPDFTEEELDKALVSFAGRQRRFGHTGDQIEQKKAQADDRESHVGQAS